MVGSRGGQPQLVVKFHHAADEFDRRRAINGFQQEMKKVRHRFSAAVGCYIADGYVDPALFDEIRKGPDVQIFWHALTRPDPMTAIAADVVRVLPSRSSTRGPPA